MRRSDSETRTLVIRLPIIASLTLHSISNLRELMNNRIFFQHTDLMRLLRVHDSIRDDPLPESFRILIQLDSHKQTPRLFHGYSSRGNVQRIVNRQPHVKILCLNTCRMSMKYPSTAGVVNSTISSYQIRSQSPKQSLPVPSFDDSLSSLSAGSDTIVATTVGGSSPDPSESTCAVCLFIIYMLGN